MSIPFRLVSLLCLLDAGTLLFFNTYFPLNPDGVQRCGITLSTPSR